MKTLAVCVCLVASLVPCVARAGDEAGAAERFREGRRAFEAHDYQRAATEFEAANRAKPAAAALLSAGLAWELGGDPLNAAIDLADALAAGGLEPRDEANARKHLADLDAKLGHLSLTGPSSARLTIDGHEQRPLPLEVRVSPGSHAIELRTPAGAEVHRIVNVDAGITITLELTPTEAPQPVTRTTPVQRTVGWVGVGIGVSAFAAGAIVGGVGLAARNDFVSGGDTSVSLHDEAITMRTVANVLWVSAGVFGIAGAILVLTAPSSHAVSVGLGPSSATLKVVF